MKETATGESAELIVTDGIINYYEEQLKQTKPKRRKIDNYGIIRGRLRIIEIRKKYRFMSNNHCNMGSNKVESFLCILNILYRPNTEMDMAWVQPWVGCILLRIPKVWVGYLDWVNDIGSKGNLFRNEFGIGLHFAYQWTFSTACLLIGLHGSVYRPS